MHSDRQITPKDWECIDGTFYVSPDGKPYMVFVHEWVQISDGSICAVELSRDLREAVSDPVTLFHASEAAGWVKPITNKKAAGPSLCDGWAVSVQDRKRPSHHALVQLRKRGVYGGAGLFG